MNRPMRERGKQQDGDERKKVNMAKVEKKIEINKIRG
jgi:hypothetical protein